MRGFGKKGLSVVLGAVFLIILAIVLALLFFIWARGLVSEQVEKFGQPIESLCAGVRFDVERIAGVGGFDKLNVINRGDVGLYGFEIKKTYQGNAETTIFSLGVPAGISASGTTYLMMTEFQGKVPDKIEMIPILSGNVQGGSERKSFTCPADQATILEPLVEIDIQA